MGRIRGREGGRVDPPSFNLFCASGPVRAILRFLSRGGVRGGEGSCCFFNSSSRFSPEQV